MKPFAYLWMANKQKLEDLPRRRLQHVADARFGHGLAWFKCRIEALSWQHLCKAGQAEHQACQPVVPARWQHAQLKMPTVCDMEPRCVKLSLRKKAAATAKAYTIFLHSQVLYRDHSVGATRSTVALLSNLCVCWATSFVRRHTPEGGAVLLILLQPSTCTISTPIIASGICYSIILLLRHQF